LTELHSNQSVRCRICGSSIKQRKGYGWYHLDASKAVQNNDSHNARHQLTEGETGR